MKAPFWKPFNRVPNAQAIADGLKRIPSRWSLTPLQDKSPKRTNWQIEDFIPHAEIARLITEGDRRISKKGNQYTGYFSGFGIRTGEPSGGIIAIDIDGQSAHPLLKAISGGDIPETVEWTSGKSGRYQIAFQIPDKFRAALKNFNRAVCTEWNGLQTARDEEGKPTELLEFRYNGVQSALPPSRHPTTGSYKWINSPDITSVAIAPQWLCDLLLKLANDEYKKEQERKERTVRWAEIQKQAKYRGGTVTNLVDFLEFEVLPKLSPEQIFNWQGHNFRDYGKTLKGCPPWRASASGTSFHVWWDGSQWAWQDKATGEGGGALQYRWQMRGGRGTPKGKDFAGIVSELARDAGVAMPELPRIDYVRRGQEPDTKLYDEYVAKEQSDDRIALAQEFRDLINRSAGKIKRFLSKGFKGFGRKPVTKITPKVLKIKPGEVPKPEEYEILGKPRLEFKGSDRSSIWAECIAKGWQHILDGSGTGSGKSHSAGLVQPSDFGVQQLWYMAVDHRNPTTATVETNYTDLPVRNNGFAIDQSRKTPLGKNFQVWGKESDTPDTDGNCDRTGLFRSLASKNIEVQQSQTSPICESCPHFNKRVETVDAKGKKIFRPKCSEQSGNGFGFRLQYSSALGMSKLRAHPNSAPAPRTDFTVDANGDFIHPAGYDYRKVGAFWDEAGTLIETQSVLEVRLADLQQTYYKVTTLLSACLFEEFKHDLEPLWQVLMALLDPNFKGYIPDSGRFGMNNGNIRGLLPEPPESLDAIIKFLEKELQPDLSFLSERGDQIDFKSVSWKDKHSARAANKALQGQDNRDKVQGLQDMPLNWFTQFLEAWRGNSGYFKRDFSGSVLRIYERSDRHTDIASSMRWNVFMDATLTPQMLADILDTEDILYIKQEMPSYKNLRVIQVTGMGRLGSDRRESADARVQAAIEELTRRHPALAVIDWKSKATQGAGCHFRDSRGVNRFKDASALVIVGTPCPNIGGLAIKYQLLKNKLAVEDSLEFQTFIHEHIQCEIIQEIGRLRANLRPDEELTAYVLSDYDLHFLKPELPDTTFEQLDAFRVTPDAGDRFQRTKHAILQAFTQVVEAGADAAKVTQDAIAQTGGITRSRISQIASKFGGWASLRKLLILLYRNLYNKTNNSETFAQPEEEPDSEFLWLANQYLPLFAVNAENLKPEEVIGEILNVAKLEGWDRFKRLLELTDKTTKLGILGYLILLLPAEWEQEFLEFGRLLKTEG